MTSPTQTPDLTPIVRGLLQALEGTLRRAGYFNGLVEAIYHEVERELLPGEKQAMLSFGLSHASWAERLLANGKERSQSGVRNAFWKISRALTRVGSSPSISVSLRVKGLEVAGVLRLVRPKAKLAPAGFEIEVTTGGKRYEQPLSREPERKRRRSPSDLEIRADQVVTSLIAAAKEGDLPPTLVKEFAAHPATPRKITLEMNSGERIELRKVAAYCALAAFLGIAAGAMASQDFRALLKEATAAAWEFMSGAGHRPAPRPTPTPQQTPPPPSPQVTLEALPGPLKTLGRTRTFGASAARPEPPAPHLSFALGLQPFLSVYQDTSCSRCFYVFAYPALQDTRPLRFHLDYGDGTTELLRSEHARPDNASSSGASRLLYRSDLPSWRHVFVAAGVHRYPDEDAVYTIRVGVDAENADGSTTTLVTLKRTVIVEYHTTVSTDATITIPTPDPDTP